MTAAPAQAAPQWAPAATAEIHPGTMMYTAGAQCTANFVFTDAASNVYVGYAAHCAGTGAATDTDGCLAGSLPLGTPVTFNEGGSLVSEGTVVGQRDARLLLVADTMHELGTTDANTCAYNDLALVKVAAADAGQGQPVDPVLGRPDRHRHQRHRRRRPGLHLRQLQPPRPASAALAAHRHQPR